MTMDINFLLKTYLYQPLESVWKINDKTIAFYFKHSVFPWLVFSLDNQSPAMFYGLHTHKLSELLLHKHPIDSFLQSKIFSSGEVFCNPNAAINCAIPYFTYFGFVTVPVISFAVFFLISYIAYAPNKK
jgi:hypothetical protein